MMSPNSENVMEPVRTGRKVGLNRTFKKSRTDLVSILICSMFYQSFKSSWTFLESQLCMVRHSLNFSRKFLKAVKECCLVLFWTRYKRALEGLLFRGLAGGGLYVSYVWYKFNSSDFKIIQIVKLFENLRLNKLLCSFENFEFLGEVCTCHVSRGVRVGAWMCIRWLGWHWICHNALVFQDFSTHFVMKTTSYMRAADPVWEKFSITLRYCVHMMFFSPCSFLTGFHPTIYTSFFNFCFNFDTANEIQTDNVGTKTSVAAEAMRRNATTATAVVG